MNRLLRIFVVLSVILFTALSLEGNTHLDIGPSAPIPKMSVANKEYVLSLFDPTNASPKQSPDHYHLAFTYYRNGQYSNTIAECERVINGRQLANASIYDLNGNAYAKEGMFDKAISNYSKALSIDQMDYIAYANRGHAYLHKHDAESALSNLTQAIALNPKIARFYDLRGCAYLASSNQAWAILDFSNAIQIDSKDFVGYEYRGEADRELGKREEAIKDFTQAIRLNAKEFVVYDGLGYEYLLKGDLNRAISNLKMAIQMEPKAASTLDNLGVAYYKMQDFDHSIKWFDEAVRISPHDARYLCDRASAFGKLGKWKLAKDDLNKAKAFYPNDARVNNNLAWLLATCPVDSMRDGKYAVTLATTACRLTSWNRWLFVGTLAAAYAENGDFDLAVKYQKQALGMVEPGKDLVRLEKTLKLYKTQKPFRQ